MSRPDEKPQAHRSPRFELKRPTLSDAQKSKAMQLLRKETEAFNDFFHSINSPKYLYWDATRHKRFMSLSPDESWYLVRKMRNFSSQKTPVKAENGSFFRWLRVPSTDALLHRIDMHVGGNILDRNRTPEGHKQFVARSIMEEAIASSQLEGAHTTRDAAKKMLIEKRKPGSESEQMILNNYRTIMAIQEDYKDEALTPELMIEMHRRLAEGTKAAEGQGRFRRNKDEIVVEGPVGNERYTTHVPPPEGFLKREIQRLCDYANDKDEKGFTHPIVKAIFIHFWVGYLHPFTDGNGRLARALFYWYLLKKGYQAMIYIPISTIIKKAPAQYSMAYIHSEQDSFDLTYFYDFHLRKIIQSMDEFEAYLKNKEKEKRQFENVLDEDVILNERQNRLLRYLMGNKGSSTTVTAHSEINDVSRQTAAKDLHELEVKQLLHSRREGKFTKFYLGKRLKKQ